MKGYKVFNPDWSCHGKQYSCPGVFEHEGKLELCKNGIHFCKELNDCFNYYDFKSDNKVAEIEAIGEIIKDEKEGKYCTSKIKIIRELSWYEVLDLVNMGNHNTGFRNTGDFNTGNHNSGNHNTGICNTGSRNSGDYNSGDLNSGDFNSGDYNSGDFNSGDYNSGDFNSGDYNSSNGNFGCFNTKKNKMTFFNKPSNWTYDDWAKSEAKGVLRKLKVEQLEWIREKKMTDEEKEKYPEYKRTKGYLKYKEEKESILLRQELWNNLFTQDKEAVLSLPNFNADIFKEITGIDVTIDKKVVLTKEQDYDTIRMY